MHFVIVTFIIQDEHKTRWTTSGSMHHLWSWENLSINMSSPCQHWTWRTPDLYDIIFKNSHSISVRLRKIFTFCLLSTKQNFINPMTLHSAHCPSCGYHHLVPWTLVPPAGDEELHDKVPRHSGFSTQQEQGEGQWPSRGQMDGLSFFIQCKDLG